MKHDGLNQLLCAAVVNAGFRQALLRNPSQAIVGGYYGHTFALTAEERSMLVGIRAQHLEDFAAQVHEWLSDNGRSGAQRQALSSKNGRHRHLSTPVQQSWVELSPAPMLT